MTLKTTTQSFINRQQTTPVNNAHNRSKVHQRRSVSRRKAEEVKEGGGKLQLAEEVKDGGGKLLESPDSMKDWVFPEGACRQQRRTISQSFVGISLKPPFISTPCQHSLGAIRIWFLEKFKGKLSKEAILPRLLKHAELSSTLELR
ncbi:hypothetical protein CDAR_429211 [Caerostris darwini]|uniref:Uncharacterized protein n=1 Tax=Caerostris darwini TaxID=1538125 RepID=A0AAV4VZC7_9ARAC|nr:hypothetical protein CDAR_429211 [Caerostris darwini]